MKRAIIAAALLVASFAFAADGFRSDSTLRLPAPITAIAWSDTLHRLAVAYDWGRSIRTVDDKGDVISEIRSEYANLSNSLSFLGNQHVVVAPSTELGSDVTDAMLSFWDADTGVFIKHITGPFPNGRWSRNRAQAFALTADSGRIAVITGSFQNSALVLVDLADGKQTKISSSGQISLPSDTFDCVDISPDGRFVAVGTAFSKLAILSTSSDANVRVLEPFPDPLPPNVLAVRFNPAASLLAVGADQPAIPGPAAHPRNEPPLRYFVGLWDVATGRLRSTLPESLAPVRQLAWSPNGRLLAIAGGDNSVRVWNTTTGSASRLATFRTSRPVAGVVWLGSDDRLAIAAGDEVTFVTVQFSGVDGD